MAKSGWLIQQFERAYPGHTFELRTDMQPPTPTESAFVAVWVDGVRSTAGFYPERVVHDPLAWIYPTPLSLRLIEMVGTWLSEAALDLPEIPGEPPLIAPDNFAFHYNGEFRLNGTVTYGSGGTVLRP